MKPKPSILSVCASLCAACALVALAACGGSSSSTPTTPVVTLAPTPKPTATPTPEPGVGIPPASSGCGQPYPPPLSEIRMKIHVKAPEYWTLDATPIVGPNLEYCTAIGYYDGRDRCPVRLEGDPQRIPCEAWILGNAEDTGRPGPTWSRDFNYWCTTFDASGCQHNPDNPLSLFITMGGQYQACRGEDICGNLEVDR